MVVRSDRGSKFRSVFHRYLSRLGVHHTLILPQHPRANSLIERVNGVILQGIRHLLQEVPDKSLEEVIPDVLAGLRFLPHKLGHQPFVASFKQFPRCLNEACAVPVGPPAAMNDMSDEQQEEAYLREHLAWWDSAVVELRERMRQYDN